MNILSTLGLGSVGVWNVSGLLQRLEMPGKDGSRDETSPLQTFTGHSCEGYALDWSPTDTGVLASGDCKKNIHVWTPGSDGQWKVSEKAFSSHTNSVEADMDNRIFGPKKLIGEGFINGPIAL